MQRLTFHSMVLGLATLGIAACVRPQQDPWRLYTLSALESADEAVTTGAADGARLSIAAGPIHLPDYLDQDQIVSRISPNRFALSETDRWAEPLEHNVASVLVENLSVLFRNDGVTVHPWSGRQRATYQLEIDVMQFETDTTGTAHLAARYVLRDGVTGQAIAAKEQRLTAAARDRTTEHAVASLSTVLGDFSVRLAAEIRENLMTPVPAATDTVRGGPTLFIPESISNESLHR